MKRKLGCLHAHYSNIEYIEKAFSHFDIELIHFVDPVLMHRVTSDDKFKDSYAQKRVKEQIEWIAECKVDAILITCTNYIAFLQEDQLSLSVPIIKIDEPYFDRICHIQEPQVILFTNPGTVEGTVKRLNAHAKKCGKFLDFEVIIINNTFELIIQGLKEKYNQEIYKYLNHLIKDEKRILSVAQLSMVEAAEQFENLTAKTIINPLNVLADSVIDRLDLQVRPSLKRW